MPGLAAANIDIDKWGTGVVARRLTVRNFEENVEIVDTTTVEAANDLEEKLVRRFDKKVRSGVCTVASIIMSKNEVL
ncbi:unnamed protein product [Euphydryas editha]|uniref:Uncharacterized protein n=1 Tax=Euphydryas editha TaxID=104508 RepID=A0AAU9UWC9_EUPED|nr:unnamed protein product [Euphydryas editha]